MCIAESVGCNPKSQEPKIFPYNVPIRFIFELSKEINFLRVLLFYTCAVVVTFLSINLLLENCPLILFCPLTKSSSLIPVCNQGWIS